MTLRFAGPAWCHLRLLSKPIYLKLVPFLIPRAWDRAFKEGDFQQKGWEGEVWTQTQGMVKPREPPLCCPPGIPPGNSPGPGEEGFLSWLHFQLHRFPCAGARGVLFLQQRLQRAGGDRREQSDPSPGAPGS